MKGSVAATAAVVAGAYAQGAYPVSYSTVTIDECPTSSYQSMITVTDGVTVTYCPECEGMSTGASGPPPTGMPTGPPPPGHTTVYTTVYDEYCSTASSMTPHTYTVTESCTEATPTWTPGPSHIPQGFTTTVVTCEMCTDHPIDVTVTQPCDCEATSGVPVGPPAPPPTGAAPPPGGPPAGPPPTGGAAPPPAAGETPCPGCVTQISDGQPQAPTGAPPGGAPPPAGPSGGAPPPAGPSGGAPPPAGPSGGAPPPAGGSPPAGGAPPPASSHCPGCVSQISDGQPQAPTGMTTKPMGSVPAVATATQHCPGGTACSAPSIVPYKGAAASVQAHFGTVSYSIIALFIGVLAVAL